MMAFIESLKDDTCTPKPAKLNAWVCSMYFVLCIMYMYMYVAEANTGNRRWGYPNLKDLPRGS